MKVISNIRHIVRRRINGVKCSFIRKNNTLHPTNKNVGYLTIFHDFEGEYSELTTKDISCKGVSRILDIEKVYNVSATYNIVGKLINDVPDLIARIKSDGHEIASHSYSHKVMTSLSKAQITNDLRLTEDIFNSIGRKLTGFRAPQSKWNFKLLDILLDYGVTWNAEADTAKYPYIIREKNGKHLLRMPVTIDDWLYKSQNIDPQKMYDILINTVDTITNEKIYGSIGFHPWIHGEDDRRVDTFERFLKYTASKKGIEILTFGQMCRLCSKKSISIYFL